MDGADHLGIIRRNVRAKVDDFTTELLLQWHLGIELIGDTLHIKDPEVTEDTTVFIIVLLVQWRN